VLRSKRRVDLAQLVHLRLNWCISEQPVSLAGGRIGCAQMLALNEPPTAIISGIDLPGIRYMRRGDGARRPVDRGVDNPELPAREFPALIIVHLPVPHIGELVAESPLAQLRGNSAAAHVDELLARNEIRVWDAPLTQASRTLLF
jgi:DNA-binding LacI/PurR family transcriptional regulator